ncbi:hypothetical protein CORC01_10089 [Colletotrichum orchidophilum]|uniref:Uncharacterized protein n=1 Tax=Colletotrichum orchidophilum TaxID=1209926 RepID=A0A1G4AZK5_9PEZI|nr:uncharacterized protein CORC01_10089 [Colletotrichum orchidophilum]OHE94561.1 hypothetical protein CORC01_10089 [Colletotrichum orchidophilum]
MSMLRILLKCGGKQLRPHREKFCYRDIVKFSCFGVVAHPGSLVLWVPGGRIQLQYAVTVTMTRSFKLRLWVDINFIEVKAPGSCFLQVAEGKHRSREDVLDCAIQLWPP